MRGTKKPLGFIIILDSKIWITRKKKILRLHVSDHVFIEPLAIQLPAEMSGATARTPDRRDSTGVRGAQKRKSASPIPEQGTHKSKTWLCRGFCANSYNFNFSVTRESLPLFTVRPDGLATYPISFIFIFLWRNAWTLGVFSQASVTSQMYCASKQIRKMRRRKRQKDLTVLYLWPRLFKGWITLSTG